MHSVKEMLLGEFLNREGNRGPDEVGDAIKKYSILSQLAGQTAGFVEAMTKVGNNARLGLKVDSSEPLMRKLRRKVEKHLPSYGEQSRIEFITSLPYVLQSLINNPEIDRPDLLVEKLRGEQITINEAYMYSYSLIRELKNLTKLLPTEEIET
jgi:hypothetical protein